MILRNISEVYIKAKTYLKVKNKASWNKYIIECFISIRRIENEFLLKKERFPNNSYNDGDGDGDNYGDGDGDGDGDSDSDSDSNNKITKQQQQ